MEFTWSAAMKATLSEGNFSQPGQLAVRLSVRPHILGT